MALLFYPHHPCDLITVYAHTQKIKIISQPHHPHNSFFFLESPLLKNLNQSNPQDLIWMKNTHRTAFLRRTTTYFHVRITTNWTEKQPKYM